jgi:hypothetical protein
MMSLARIAGLVYVVTFVSGTLALLVPTGRMVTNMVAATSYIAVTILFYFLFRPVNRGVSLLAMVVSLTGCVVSVLIPMRIISWPSNPLPFFGVYCLLIGYLVFNSTYLPRFLGVLMMLGGIGWLTFAVPSAAAAWSPYNFIPGIIAEAALTVWLVIFGVRQSAFLAANAAAR